MVEGSQRGCQLGGPFQLLPQSIDRCICLGARGQGTGVED